MVTHMEAKDVLQRCPLCQEAYCAGSVCALDQAPGRPSRYHCYCQACKRAMVAILHETSGWLSSIGMLTEFTADEAVRAGELAPIDAEACLQYTLSLHDALDLEYIDRKSVV